MKVIQEIYCNFEKHLDQCKTAQEFKYFAHLLRTEGSCLNSQQRKQLWEKYKKKRRKAIMDIEQIKQNKYELENALSGMLREFEENTGLQIESIFLDRAIPGEIVRVRLRLRLKLED